MLTPSPRTATARPKQPPPRPRAAPLAATPPDTHAGTTTLSALNPSLLEDLRRFERRLAPGSGLDALEVFAAGLRHGRDLRLHLRVGSQIVQLALRPTVRQVHSPLSSCAWAELPLRDVQVLRVEAAAKPAPDDAEINHAEPLGPLLWQLALRGARVTLLPEIAGRAAYRVVPGDDFDAPGLGAPMIHAVARLREQMTPLRALARWPGLDEEQAVRLLNGLYLQSSLMVSRTQPGSIDLPLIGR